MEPRQFKICLDGIYVRQDGPLITGWEKLKDPKDLAGYAGDLLDMEAPVVGIKWQGAKIPMSVMAPVIGTIQRFPNMETGYQLYYKPKEGRWCVRCPRQAGRSAAVYFENDLPMFNGFIFEGTIHTHPNMDAFWSGMDLSTNAKRFGIHMVFGLQEGRIKTGKITIFTRIGNYDLEYDDIFEEDVKLFDPCEPNQEWVDTISEQFRQDFKLMVDGTIFGPSVPPRQPCKVPISLHEIQHMHDLNQEMLLQMRVDKNKKKPASKFQQLLVEKYGYDAEALANWLEDTVDYGMDYPEETLIYEQHADGVGWADGIMASDDMRAFLDDSATAFGSEFKPDMTVNEQILVTVLYERITSCNLVEKAHAAEDLDEYEEDLKVIFEYIPEETLRILIEDFRDQLDFACGMGNDVLFGGRLLTPTAFRWAEAAMRNPGVDHTGRDLAEVLDRCADMNGCLSWHAMALLLVALETTPMTCIHLWELYQRMKKEGRLEEC